MSDPVQVSDGLSLTSVILSYIIMPIILGATIGSFYFLVSYKSEQVTRSSILPLIVLFAVSFFFGYSAGYVVSDTAWAMFVALISSSLAVEVLDSTTRSIRDDRDPPKILVWLTDLVKSLRGK